MKISLIAACADNNVIGLNNQLPWHLPQDLKHFKALTINKSIIMGRKTYESIGKPLPNRQNIVITRNNTFQAPGCDIAHSLDDAIALATSSEVMIIGGAQIYQKAFPKAQCLYLTRVHLSPEGDAFFPVFNMDDWQLDTQEDHPSSEENPVAYSFETYLLKAITSPV